MSPGDQGCGPIAAAAAAAKSRVRSCRLGLALILALLAFGALSGPAYAHGPVNPIASSYLAKIGQVPAGLEARVVDGDVRMWLRVAPAASAEVLDYRGGAYLRLSRAGVEVNVNSAMYYLNQNPAEIPPAKVSPALPPRWRQISSAHDYVWHDGRLQALASVALSPGSTYVGTWRIPLLVDGRAGAISGSLLYASNPSIVWFWPIAVLLACVLAALRLRRPELDARLARVLAITALIAFAVAAVGRELHGRPAVSVDQLVTLAVALGFAAWGLRRALFEPPGWFGYFLISMAALWGGLVGVPTLTHGYVLMSLPAFVARAAAVLCLGAGAGLFLSMLRIADRGHAGAKPIPADRSDDWDQEDAASESFA
jgi:hypothetical protein